MFQRIRVSVLIFLVTVVAGLVAMPALTQPRVSHTAASPVQENQSVLVLPYIAVGGVPEGWHFLTVVSLENPNSSETSGAFEFFSKDGTPLHVQLDDEPEMAATTAWTLPAKDSKILILTHPGDNLQAGFLRVKLAGHMPVDVIVLIQFYNGEELVSQAVVLAGPGSGEQKLASYQLTSAHRPLGLNRTGDSMTSLVMPSPEPRIKMLNVLPVAEKAARTVPARRPGSPSVAKPVMVQRGYASWYGYSLHGRKAADGEIYDQRMLTAAHRTLPLGTKARVTNLRNHLSVTVRITDRGPYVRGRIIDLSLAAAREIGMVEAGVSHVKLEIWPSSKKGTGSKLG